MNTSNQELSIMYLEQELENAELRLLESIWALEAGIRRQLKILERIDANISQLTLTLDSNQLEFRLRRNNNE